MRIAFVLNDLRLSGGVNVVLQHASRLATAGGHSVSLILRDDQPGSWSAPYTSALEILPWKDVSSRAYDVAIATYWETLLLLGQVKATSYIWFCQLYEDRFFPDRNPSISTMQVAGSIPLPVITEAHWLKDLLVAENPDRKVEVVLNGIEKSIFNKGKENGRPLDRFDVLVEGSLDALAKNTQMALQGSLSSQLASSVLHVGNRPYLTDDPRYQFVESTLSFDEMAELYARHHVLVKTPIAEGMFGPPLEAFHCGLPALVTPVTGAEEYIEDGVNAFLVSWNNPGEIAQRIDELARNRSLWNQLSAGALATADAWPDWDQQSSLFEEMLKAVSKESKLSQHDLANMGRTIQFADLMHWLAMRRLSDKDAGPKITESLLAPSPPSFSIRLIRLLHRVSSAVGFSR